MFGVETICGPRGYMKAEGRGGLSWVNEVEKNSQGALQELPMRGPYAERQVWTHTFLQ